MLDPDIIYSDAVQKVIDKTLLDLKQSLPAAHMKAIQRLVDQGEFLDVESILTIAEQDESNTGGEG